MPKPYAVNIRDAAVAAYTSGGTVPEAARASGMSATSVRRELARRGIPLRPTNTTPIPYDGGGAPAAIAAYLAGATIAAACRGRCSYEAFRAEMSRRGIARRRYTLPPARQLRATRTDPKVLDAAVAAYTDGAPAANVGILAGISGSTVLRAARARGVTPRPKGPRVPGAQQRPTREMLDRAVADYLGPDSPSIHEAAARAGMSASPLRRELTRRGIQARPRIRTAPPDALEAAVDAYLAGATIADAIRGRCGERALYTELDKRGIGRRRPRGGIA